MAYEGNTGIQVASQYGPRTTGVSVGVEGTDTAIQVLQFELTSRGIADNSGFTPPFFVPKYAKILRAWITVDTALTGVTAVNIGEGDASVNALQLVTADLALGTRDVSGKLVGTWATAATGGVQRTANVRVVTTGAPTTRTGLATVSIEYLYKSRNDAGWVPDKTTLPTYKAQPV